MDRAIDGILSSHGIRLLERESVLSTLDLKSGSTGRFAEGLILTNRRVFHISRGSSRSGITAALEDIPSIAVDHEPKQHWLIAVGAALALGGLVINPFALLPGVPIFLIGAVLLGGGLPTGSNQIEVQLGNREVYADLKRRALDDAEDFAGNFFQAKAR